MKLTMNELRRRVCAALHDDQRFDARNADGCGWRFWDADIEIADGDAYTVIINDSEQQSLMRLPFTVGADDTVTLSPDAPTKTEAVYAEDARAVTAAHHLVTEKGGETHLPVPDRKHAGMAWAALHKKGFRGKKYSGPDKEGAIDRLKALYKTHDWPLPTDSEEAEMSGKDYEGEYDFESEPAEAVTMERAEKFNKEHVVVDCFRTAVKAVNKKPPEWIVWAPAGTNTIYPAYKGKPVEVTVTVDAETLHDVTDCIAFLREDEPNAEFWADFNHKKEGRAFSPTDWKYIEAGKDRGVCMKPEWSGSGGSAIVDGDFLFFSPRPLLDAEFDKATLNSSGVLVFPRGARGSRENPCRIVGVDFNVGGLTNDPAFKGIPQILPVAAQHSAATAAANKPNKGAGKMKIYFIKAPAVGGYAKGAHVEVDDAVGQGYITGGEAIHEDNFAAFQNSMADYEALQAEVKTGRESKAALDRQRVNMAIEAKIGTGAIAPKAKTKNGKGEEVLFVDYLRSEGEVDAERTIRMIEAMVDRPDLVQRTVAKDKRDNAVDADAHAGDADAIISVENCSVEDAVRGYVMCQAEAREAQRSGTAGDVLRLIRSKAARIHERHLHPLLKKGNFFGVNPKWMDGIFKAAGVESANALGTLAATNIVVQEFLQLLEQILHPFTDLSTDFSDEGAVFGQSIITRTRAVPVVNQGSSSFTAYNDSDASTTDVNLTLNNWPYVQVAFYAGTIASTTRDLAKEQLGPQLYAIAQSLFATFCANFTQANYDKTPFLGRVGFSVGGTPNRTTLIGIDSDMDLLLNPPEGRIAMFATPQYNQLRTDPYLVSWIGMGNADEERSGMLGRHENVMPYKTQTLNSRGDIVGFALTPSGAVLASRIPELPEKMVNVSFPGVRDIVTAPNLGLSLLVTKFVQPDGSACRVRVEVLFGAAVGQAAAAELLTP